MKRLFKPAVTLMSRLKYPQKFALISLLFAIPLALVMTLFILQINSKINFAQKELYGNVYLRSLRQLLEDTLQSKLAAHDYLEGEVPDQNQLAPLQAKIDQDMAELAAVDRQLGRLLQTGDKFESLQ